MRVPFVFAGILTFVSLAFTSVWSLFADDVLDPEDGDESEQPR
jgi:hypothetical protein